MYSQSDVLEYVKEEDVKFVRLCFFDLKGKQKNISIIADQLERAFKYGISFDASSIEGFSMANRSDMFLHPVASTLCLIPWRPTSGKVVRMFCEIRHPDGSPFEKDSRYILKTAIEKAKKELGINFKFGSEMEFYLCKMNEAGENTNIPFDNASYMDIAPDDKGENIRREICFTLEQMGISPEASHHEMGPGQNEIDFHYSDPLTAADNTQTFKWIVRTKSNSAGLYADFSPKPFLTEAGSGMHVNISCGDNTMYACAGILKHIKEMTLFLNPSQNSYNRLGEFKAPKFVACGKENRTSCIRLPATKIEPRIEVRSPDSECNPYIAFALLIYAAMDGIKNKLVCENYIEEDLFTADKSVTDKLELLPDTLEEAKRQVENSAFIKEVLSPEIVDYFINM
ncbi:MAG: glutamine synthetase family protein [Treponemataceae bacterium]|nr:glutamine synthetase family protein [Treponemataceae bacterium]